MQHAWSQCGLQRQKRDYGFDIHISTGVTHLLGTILYAFATVLNGIWLGLLFVFRGSHTKTDPALQAIYAAAKNTV